MPRRLPPLAACLAFGPLTLACGEENLGPGVDCNTEQTPPSVTWLEPEAGATVGGTVDLVVNATDDCAITAVRFTVNDGPTIGTLTNWVDQPEPTTFTFSLSWDSRSVANGSVTVTAYGNDSRIASDSDPTPRPNTGHASRQFTVMNP
jgi:hypothetical protein